MAAEQETSQSPAAALSKVQQLGGMYCSGTLPDESRVIVVTKDVAVPADMLVTLQVPARDASWLDATRKQSRAAVHGACMGRMRMRARVAVLVSSTDAFGRTSVMDSLVWQLLQPRKPVQGMLQHYCDRCIALNRCVPSKSGCSVPYIGCAFLRPAKGYCCWHTAALSSKPGAIGRRFWLMAHPYAALIQLST